MQNIYPAGIIPPLPETLADAVEAFSQDRKYRFTNTGPDSWTVHQSNRPAYKGSLSRDGSRYDYSYTDNMVSAQGTGITLPELFTVFL
jgi:hypothetical protein